MRIIKRYNFTDGGRTNRASCFEQIGKRTDLRYYNYIWNNAMYQQVRTGTTSIMLFYSIQRDESGLICIIYLLLLSRNSSVHNVFLCEYEILIQKCDGGPSKSSHPIHPGKMKMIYHSSHFISYYWRLIAWEISSKRVIAYKYIWLERKPSNCSLINFKFCGS